MSPLDLSLELGYISASLKGGTMRDLTAAAVQMNGRIGKVGENLKVTLRWAERAKELGAELVLFPELNVTGHWPSPELIRYAEEVPEGPSTRALAGCARDLGLVIAFGIAELRGGCVYNTQVLVGPRGYIGKASKLHLSHDEYFYFRPGRDVPVFDLGGYKVGIMICYDTMFPEHALLLALKGAEVLLAPHAARRGKFPRSERSLGKEFRKRLRTETRRLFSRAYDTGSYLVYTDQVGEAGEGIRHGGVSFVLGPDGEVLASCSKGIVHEDMTVAKLSADALLRRRGGSCFPLNTRRTEVFSELREL